MEYVKIGGSGLRVSRICLGMLSYGRNVGQSWTVDRWPWTLDEREAEPIVRSAVDGGITFFDTADVYNGGQSEIVTGRLLRKFFAMREEYVLATKVRMPSMPGENGWGLSRKHIMAAIDASLTRLGTDYVDLYQIHRWDPDTPIEETMEALHDVVRAGKARYLGASNLFAWQFAKAQSVARTRMISMQNHYNLIYREEEREMIPQCLDMGVGVLPFSPLARGLLAGARDSSARARSDTVADEFYRLELDRPVIDRLNAAADQRAVPPAQVALAWLLHRPGVTAPIVGATKPGHLHDSLAAEQLDLSAEEIALLEEAYQAHPVVGHTVAPAPVRA
ncbi:aldo/keto reductase [Amycolatopsis pithecellobii]|uniref:Aldo/keto reductase n=1 Tax=Amycolatopsis pithecellobii TaxID=664692 RepID=A0A6N7Z3I4_9PSEU|nr:aldo/keto reductase [Amycolatopsis pithecellobii]MTD56493.1 aldo/keto reductase [Amycolatopsis pithecellobii]